MPIVRIELFPGRDAEKKAAIAREVTKALEASAGIDPADTTVIFDEVKQADWFVAGESFAARRSAG